jgi:hypothetical protein
VTSKPTTSVVITKPNGVYNHEALKPPGITNSALNCYANAIFQCLMSSKSFSHLINAAICSHSTSCEECKKPGVYTPVINIANACHSTGTLCIVNLFKPTMFTGPLSSTAVQ